MQKWVLRAPAGDKVRVGPATLAPTLAHGVTGHRVQPQK